MLLIYLPWIFKAWVSWEFDSFGLGFFGPLFFETFIILSCHLHTHTHRHLHPHRERRKHTSTLTTYTHTPTHTHTHTHTHREGERERERERERRRHTQTHTQGQTDRQTDSQTNRETDRLTPHTHDHTHTETHTVPLQRIRTLNSLIWNTQSPDTHSPKTLGAKSPRLCIYQDQNNQCPKAPKVVSPKTETTIPIKLLKCVLTLKVFKKREWSIITYIIKFLWC